MVKGFVTTEVALNNLKAFHDALFKTSVATDNATQSMKEFKAEYDSIKSHFNPIVWFFIRIFYK